MLFIIKVLEFFLFSSQCLAGLSDAYSFAPMDNQCASRQKESMLWCMAQCLDLEGATASIKCELAIKFRSMHFTFKGPNKVLCGKKFNFGTPVLLPHEHVQYASPAAKLRCHSAVATSPTAPVLICIVAAMVALLTPAVQRCAMQFGSWGCGFVDKTLKTWNPKDADDVKCVLNNLSAEWQKLGKIGIHAFKSRSKKNFKICEIETPRILDSKFLPIVENKNVTLGTYNGTCAMITYNMTKDIGATNLTLVEISCVDSTAPYLCEAK